jgi:prolyl-tRNA editing enzyme YbaK/EbsC (Cys-tRNA(Pro) deacylase)
MTLSNRARQFQDYLDSNGYQFIVQELPDSTRTARDAAAALGCEIGQIVKSLVFQNATTGEAVLVLASGSNRVDESRISALVDAEILKADADFVRRATGFAIGGVPPLGHKSACQTFVDEDLLKYPEVWAAAGTPNAVFRITGDLQEILPPHLITRIC